MPNWLASELCMVSSFSLGAWKTFKVLKHGGTDYNLLKTWCLLGFLRVFEEYFEFFVSWIPFYWMGKCVGLGLLFLPDGNISSVVFQRVVIWGMDNAHHVLNNLVVPSVVEFFVTLPWRFLLILFPTLPPPSSSDQDVDPKIKARGKRKGKGRALRLEHLKMPAARAANVLGPEEKADKTSRKPAENFTSRRSRTLSPPPLPPRSPPHTPLTLHQSIHGSAKRGGPFAITNSEDGPADQRDGDTIDSLDQAVRTPNGRHTSDGASSKDSSPAEEGRKSTPRQSLGEMVRSAFTGNAKVRLRDHLFDLGTASPAPPVSETLEAALPPLTQVSGDSSEGKQQVQRRSNTKSTASRLPGVSNGDAVKRRGQRASSVGGSTEEEEGQTSSVETRSRYATRRRPSDLPRKSSGSSGGGDEAGGRQKGAGSEGGGSSDRSRAGLRRRSGSARRPTAKERTKNLNGEIHTNGYDDSRSYSYAAMTTAVERSNRTNDETAETRAKRLSEWRRKRAAQRAGDVASSTQQQQRAMPLRRSSRTAAIRDIEAAPTAASRDGSGGGRGFGRNPSAGASTSGRRFRHVERFRSEMSKNVGAESVGEVGDMFGDRDPSLSSTATAVSRSSR